MVGSGLFAPSSAAMAAGLNPLADHLMRTQASASSAAGRGHLMTSDLFSHQRNHGADGHQNAFFHENMVVVDEDDDDDGDIDVDEDVCGDEVEDVADGDFLQVDDERGHLFRATNGTISSSSNSSSGINNNNNNSTSTSTFASAFDLFKFASMTSPASIGTASSSFTKLTPSADLPLPSSSGAAHISNPLERIRQLHKQSISALVNSTAAANNNNNVVVDNDQKKMINLLVPVSATPTMPISSAPLPNTFKPIRELTIDFDEEEEDDEDGQQSSSPCFEDLDDDAHQHPSTSMTCRNDNSHSNASSTAAAASHIPTDEEKAQFQRSLSSATSLVFHRRAGLPLTSSPVSTQPLFYLTA